MEEKKSGTAEGKAGQKSLGASKLERDGPDEAGSTTHLHMGIVKVPKGKDGSVTAEAGHMDTGLESGTTTFDDIETLSASIPTSAGRALDPRESSPNTDTVMERMEMSDVAKASVEKHKEMIAMFELRKRARALPVPTQDSDVKQTLRQLGHAVTLFGEGAYERRERLRLLMAKPADETGDLGAKIATAVADVTDVTEVAASPQTEKVELFYTEGTEDLRQARLDIAKFSLPRSCARLQAERAYNVTVDILDYEDHVKEFHSHLKGMGVNLSQVGDDRPLTYSRFSPDCSVLATASWGPVIKLWNVPSGEIWKNLRGHANRVNCVAWRNAEESEGDAAVHLVSCGADCSVKLWNVKNGACVATLSGHEDRVNRVAVHPCGRYAASSSHDHTWRLWDLTTQTELLVQEGHTKPVYALKFHPDGSLLLSGDLGGVIRLWDLRTGKALIPLMGHVKQVISIDVNPHAGCHIISSCSDDNTVRIWDLRRRKCTDTVLAHTKLVSECMFEPLDGRYMMTSGFDGLIKLWSSLDYSCFWQLTGGVDSRVMSADISEDGKMLASVYFDRTWKLWLNENDMS